MHYMSRKGMAILLTVLGLAAFSAVAPPPTGAAPAPSAHAATPAPASGRAVGGPATAPPQRVPVLLYHHLDPGADGTNGAIITPAAFEAQMAWLAEHGYTAIDTRDLAAWLLAGGSLPARPVLITFDDGYRSVYQYVYPVLRKYGLKMTLFLTGSKVGTRPGLYDYITWDEIREMREAGYLDLQSHTFNAHYFVSGQAVLTAWDREQIRADSAQLARAFQEHGIAPPKAYAYPYGAYDAEVIEAIAADGFQLGFTVARGLVERGSAPLMLPRLTVYPWTPFCAFQAMVTGADPAVTCSPPPSGALRP